MTLLETKMTEALNEILLESAKAAIQAKDAKKYAEEAYKNIESDTIATFVALGQTTLMVEDTKVTVEGLDEVRRTIDINALADMIPATVLAKVTKQAIDLTKFDEAVSLGLIPAEVVAAVVTEKGVKPSLRITAKAKK